MSDMPVEVRDFETKKIFKEKVFGRSILNWLYNTRSGSRLGQFLTRELPCSLYGKFKSSGLSKYQISSFIDEYEILQEEYPVLESYKSFNDFFKRRFLPKKRVFSNENLDFPAFCEGRYLIYNSIQDVPIKGCIVDPKELLSNKISKDKSEQFENGQVIICRLAPVDYHRFHFPDDGEIINHYSIDGRLDSVSPYATRLKKDILTTNKRQVSILMTKNFGQLAYIEIGAFCVGTIVQDHLSPEFYRGAEKGHFLFGGSTVVILTSNKSIKFDEQILIDSLELRETFVKLGTTIGKLG